MRDRYYSKVILFGEYSMIFDATALMIPLKRFSAQWQFPQSRNLASSLPSNHSLKQFCKYLSENQELSNLFDFQSFNKDLNEGLFLASNVPMVWAVRERWSRRFTTVTPYKKPMTACN